jgi:hypothetical protein
MDCIFFTYNFSLKEKPIGCSFMATGIGCMQQQQQADPQAASEHEINGVPTNTLHSCRKIKKKTKKR